LIDREYGVVVPQFPADGYRTDLIVVGDKSRLAAECDGDAWHGPTVFGGPHAAAVITAAAGSLVLAASRGCAGCVLSAWLNQS
jgi:hypothetical protein